MIMEKLSMAEGYGLGISVEAILMSQNFFCSNKISCFTLHLNETNTSHTPSSFFTEG